jgi:broad-specificity NMP kinase
MSIIFRKPCELNDNKPLQCLLYGKPGIGKTTMALSAPNPLLIDLEDGIYRVEERLRKTQLRVWDYQDLLDVLQDKDNLQELMKFESIVIDPYGKLVLLIVDWLMKQNSSYKNVDGTMNLKGWGALKVQLGLLTRTLYSLKKNLIFVCHEIEDKDNQGNKYIRPQIAGSGKDIISDIDLMGYIHIAKNKRVVGFSPSDEYNAKNSFDLNSVIEIPSTAKGNTFLVDNILQKINEKRVNQKELLEKYNRSINEFRKHLDMATTPNDFNVILGNLKEKEIIWDNMRIFKKSLKEKADSMGAVFSQDSQAFEFLAKA